jgi:cellobiose phosphorylase
MSAYNAHPVYSRLFIETEALPNQDALLAHRRAAEVGDHNPWLVHTVYVEGQIVGAPEFETDRSRFIGRGRSASIPQAIQTTQRLSGASGHVIDPMFCLRRRVELAPEASAHFYFVTGIAASREKALEMIQQMHGALYIQRTFELAWTRSRVELRHLNLTFQQANLFQWMASQLFYFNPYRSQRSQYILNNRKGQSGLWPYGISGDFPIVLVRLTDPEELTLIKTVLRAHEYWRMKGMKVDLVILNDFQGSYEQPLQEALQHLIETSSERNYLDQPGGVFLRSGRLMPEVDQILLETVARISLHGNGGNLEKQLQPKSENELLPVRRQILLPKEVTSNLTVMTQPKGLLFFNGWGGFTNSGSEYVITLKAKDLPPSPWINVIANPKFGFQVSESGGGYTWAANSREFKLTPWSNDPVLDPSGEICYLRDEENGMVWSFTPLPIRDDQPYTVRHGQGYTIFSHVSQGIMQTGTYFVPLNEPLKIIKLTLRNTGKKPRRLAITYYLEWVLGVNRTQTAPYINTKIDPASGALLAHNVYQDNFSDQFGFLQMVAEEPEIERSWTGDRAEFVGRNGSLAKPAALSRPTLSNLTGSGYNPCGAMQLKINLGVEGEQTVTIIIGSAKSNQEMHEYLKSYRQTAMTNVSYQEVQEFWDDLLGQVQVYTPDSGLNLLLNRWLIYQTLSCRLWARSAFYQSGGAYGFRDQLQDCLALLYAKPLLAKAQIVKHAAHQFREGDVEHWWHEETGYGIRTRFSDDLLWLPYTVLRYTEHTGDNTLWQEVIPFLEGEPLQELEMEHYGLTKISAEKASLYEHCLRAIDRSLQFGSHGLPLMGGGDWNDGMNQVGKKGQGESIWLGWFLYTICQGIIPVCLEQGDELQAQKFQTAAEQLMEALNRSGWDGYWYRRAYSDNGEPLGSSINNECQIDCIAQAWAVISGAAPKEKAMMAMNSFDEKLVLREDSLVNLLTPPFNNTTPSPGYIQAYPPGVRENGGQYTHGAVWSIIAWAMLGEGNRAYELFHMLSPINHSRNHNEVQRYKVEPYVMAADVYSVPPYVGRGGWSWYTGAAGWMYQAGLEWILGLQKKGSNLLLNPCIPEDLREYQIKYKFGQTTYQISVKNPSGKQSGCDLLELDGKSLPPKSLIPLINDGQVHQVLLVL